ncbi:MAG: ROK family transcriptional regulator [Pseudomonadota bacterium]
MEKAQNPTRALRNANRAAILRLLVLNDGMQRADISAMTGLTGAAVSRIVRELLDCGLLSETSVAQLEGQLGRRSVSLSIDGSGAAVIAITISANRRSVALYNARREECLFTNLEHVEFAKPETALAAIAEAIEAIIAQHDSRIPIVGIGVGMAAPSTDHISEHGVVTSDVLEWKNVAVAEILREKTGLPVKVETRASAILRAELKTVTDLDSRNPFLVNVGVGVGSASNLEGGYQWSGSNGFGRLSHISHPQSDTGCPCGRRGCLEQAATGAAVVRDVFGIPDQQHIPFAEMGPNLAEAAKRAEQGDEHAKDAFFEAGRKMALGVDIALAMLNPDVILLAGETGRQRDYVRGVRRGLRELRSPLAPDQLQISKARSSEGSACIGLDAFVYSGKFTPADIRVA